MPTVWIMVAVTFGSAPSNSVNRRMPRTLGSVLLLSAKAPRRTTLSVMFRLPRRGNFQPPPKQSRGAGFIGINEDQIKGSALFLGQKRKQFQRRTHSKLYQGGQMGSSKIGACDFCMMPIKLQADQAALGRQRARQPNGAISAQGPDLQDGTRAMNLGQEL